MTEKNFNNSYQEELSSDRVVPVQTDKWSLDRVKAFADSLENMEPHRRTGFLISAYSDGKKTKDLEVLKALTRLVKKWNGHPSIREDLTPHGQKLEKICSMAFATQQTRCMVDAPADRTEAVLIIANTRLAIGSIFQKGGLPNPLLRDLSQIKFPDVFRKQNQEFNRVEW